MKAIKWSLVVVVDVVEVVVVVVVVEEVDELVLKRLSLTNCNV